MRGQLATRTQTRPTLRQRLHDCVAAGVRTQIFSQEDQKIGRTSKDWGAALSRTLRRASRIRKADELRKADQLRKTDRTAP
jgi:hypothetical protein